MHMYLESELSVYKMLYLLLLFQVYIDLFHFPFACAKHCNSTIFAKKFIRNVLISES